MYSQSNTATYSFATDKGEFILHPIHRLRLSNQPDHLSRTVIVNE